MKKETTTLNPNHWSIRDYGQRMKSSEWRELLLNEQDKIFYKGNLVKLKAEKLGFGVVEVSKDLAGLIKEEERENENHKMES